MRISVLSLGKRASVIAAMALLTTTTSFIPAEAANRAGGPCPKQNAKARIGGDQYVCTKNPLVKNAKRTWVWTGCLIANKEYFDSITNLEGARDKLASTTVMIDQDIKALNDKKPEFEARAIALEQDAKAWKIKSETALTQASAIRSNLDAAGFKISITKSYVDDLRTVLRPPVDNVITPTEVERLTTKWNTTSDKLNLYYQAIKEYSLRESSQNFLQGERNALKSAAAIRNEIAKQVAGKEKTKSDLGKGVTSLELEVKAKNSTRKMACTAGL